MDNTTLNRTKTIYWHVVTQKSLSLKDCIRVYSRELLLPQMLYMFWFPQQFIRFRNTLNGTHLPYLTMHSTWWWTSFGYGSLSSNTENQVHQSEQIESWFKRYVQVQKLYERMLVQNLLLQHCCAPSPFSEISITCNRWVWQKVGSNPNSDCW